LVGSEIFDLSALVLTQFVQSTCLYENMMTINLRRVHKNMSGEIKIKCAYQPLMSVKAKNPE
jgi:hypothetical protein